jgi:hypothetical protein
MGYGKSIRFYLPSGSINGIRHAEIVNWTGQAISCPRSQFKELKDWPDTTKPGVYFLFGSDDEGLTQATYIGEAENVHERLKNHIANKDFWNEAVCFTSKDENLTKSHVKYLESILISQAKEIGRYDVHNSVSPNNPALPISDRDAMTEFAANIRTLLGALGHKVLEPYINTVAVTESVDDETEGVRLRLQNKNAYGSRVSDGFLVYSGSEMSIAEANSMSKGGKALRRLLVDEGVVTQAGDVYRFGRDWLFSSPSAAADSLNGYPTSGPEAWKNDAGVSLKELEAS